MSDSIQDTCKTYQLTWLKETRLHSGEVSIREVLFLHLAVAALIVCLRLLLCGRSTRLMRLFMSRLTPCAQSQGIPGAERRGDQHSGGRDCSNDRQTSA